MLDIQVTLTKTPKPHPAEETLVFGRNFTDHMFVMDYDEGAAGTTRASSRIMR